MKNKIELVKTLKEMKNSMSKANELMDKIEDVNDYIAQSYPFNLSFDELNLEVGNWIESIELAIALDKEEKENKILKTIENMAFALGYDLEDQEDITYDMILDGYLLGNLDVTKKEIKEAVEEWISDTAMNYPEVLEEYRI